MAAQELIDANAERSPSNTERRSRDALEARASTTPAFSAVKCQSGSDNKENKVRL